jgi:exopolysaccharide biosynthesis polyprenyl glycosylphosphotransferase
MATYFFNYKKKCQYIVFLCDILVLVLAIFTSYAIRLYINQENPSINAVLAKFNLWQLVIILFHWLTLYVMGQYDFDRFIEPVRSSAMVVVSVLLAGLLISGILFFFPKYVFGRQVLLIHIIVVSIFLVSWRLLFLKIIVGNINPKQLAVVGEKNTILSFVDEVGNIPNNGFEVKQICLVNGNSKNTAVNLPENINLYYSVSELIENNGFDVLTFDSTTSRFSNEDIQRMLQVKQFGKEVYDLPELYKSITGKVPLTYIDGRWLLNSNGLQGKISLPYVRAKRIVDIVLSIFLLIISSPFFSLIAMAIKLNSKGSIIFSQERLGFQRKPFNCLKFRTMVENAEKSSGPIWAIDNDLRITKVGRILRKTRLDELPQLWNILKGDMGFIGPRPIRKYFANQLSSKIAFYEMRFSVRPGLSGWAQVNHDYAGSESGQLEKFQYELFYIQNMSLLLDLLTVFKTIQKVFRGEGK